MYVCVCVCVCVYERDPDRDQDGPAGGRCKVSPAHKQTRVE